MAKVGRPWSCQAVKLAVLLALGMAVVSNDSFSEEPSTESGNTTAEAEGTHASRRFDAAALLPAGAGKDLTVTACTKCHDLAGLEAYKGYWNKAQWTAMVESMVKNGAELDAAQMDIVANYLTSTFGRVPTE